MQNLKNFPDTIFHPPFDQCNSQSIASVSNSQLNSNLVIKEFDLPPTYDEVMKSCLYLKQREIPNMISPYICKINQINFIKVPNGNSIIVEAAENSSKTRDVLDVQLIDCRNIEVYN
uniref:Uncharacterized protein n=1 Tax=Glossina brevipalpis TaxID=37001 RepID=A0A1A9W9R0_9MUSC